MTQFKSAKYFAIVLCSVLILFATACGPSRPSEAAGRAALERRYRSEGDIAKVDSLKRTDGQEIAMGQTYIMSYEATSECIAASCGVCPIGEVDFVFPKSTVIKMPGGVATCTLFDRGARFTTRGKLIFAKSEKGWTAQ